MEEEEGEEEKEARKTEMEEKDEEQRFFIDNADHYQKRLNERRKVLKKWWDEEFSCFGGEFPNKRRRRQPTSAELRLFFEEMLGPDRSALLAERQKKQADTLRWLILNPDKITESSLKYALVAARHIIKSTSTPSD